MSHDDGTARPTIKPREDGPLRVDGLRNLFDANGGRLATENRGKGNIALCRCGASGTKPYCDGTHRVIGFRAAGATQVTAPPGKGEGGAGDAPAPPAASTRPDDPGDDLSAIRVTAAGPYVVTGGIALPGTRWPEGGAPAHYSLCRCGHSDSRPFCDGSHRQAGFDDPGLEQAARHAFAHPDSDDAGAPARSPLRNAASHLEDAMEVPEQDYRRIERTIHSDDSPVGIDATKTHVMILHRLEQIEARLRRLEESLAGR